MMILVMFVRFCMKRELEEVHCLKQMEQEKKTRNCQSDANAVGSEDLQVIAKSNYPLHTNYIVNQLIFFS